MSGDRRGSRREKERMKKDPRHCWTENSSEVDAMKKKKIEILIIHVSSACLRLAVEQNGLAQTKTKNIKNSPQQKLSNSICKQDELLVLSNFKAPQNPFFSEIEHTSGACLALLMRSWKVCRCFSRLSLGFSFNRTEIVGLGFRHPPNYSNIDITHSGSNESIGRNFSEAFFVCHVSSRMLTGLGAGKQSFSPVKSTPKTNNVNSASPQPWSGLEAKIFREFILWCWLKLIPSHKHVSLFLIEHWSKQQSERMFFALLYQASFACCLIQSFVVPSKAREKQNKSFRASVLLSRKLLGLSLNYWKDQMAFYIYQKYARVWLRSAVYQALFWLHDLSDKFVIDGTQSFGAYEGFILWS